MATRRKILAIASGGGHWVQLLRLRPAFAGHDVVYATVDAAYAGNLDGEPLVVVKDATRWNKLGVLLLGLQIAWHLVRVRPDVIVSTGAAPGYLAIRIGKTLLRARTVWIDSVANIEQLSLSGRMVGRHADLWLTQWPHLAVAGGPEYRGAVL